MDTGNSLPPAIATPSIDAAAPRANVDPAAAKKTGQDFEAFFLSQVFEHMFAGVQTDSVFGGGNGEAVYRSLLLQQYSKVAAKSGGIGIADTVQREILRAQEAK
jgi:flagellar protein FlgJ